MRLRAIVVLLGLMMATQAMAQQQQGGIFPATPFRFGVPVTRVEGFGARALGMGGAFTAVADDATAAAWNPAGLGQLEGTQVQAGFSYFNKDVDRNYSVESDYFNLGESLPSRESLAGDLSSASSSDFRPDFLTLAYPIPLGEFDQHQLTLGGSVHQTDALIDEFLFRNSVLQTTYLFEDRQFATISNAGSSSYELIQTGETWNYDFSLAYSHNDQFLVGVTIAYLSGTRDIREITRYEDVVQETYFWDDDLGTVVGDPLGPATAPTTNAYLVDWQTETSGFTATLGLLWRVHDKVNIGLTYRPEVSLDYTYRVTQETEHDLDDRFQPPYGFTVARNTVEFDMPQFFSLGIAFRGLGNTTLALDYSQTDFSDTKVRMPGQWFPGVEGWSTDMVEYHYPSLVRVDDADGTTYGGGQFKDKVYRAGGETVFPFDTWEFLLRYGLYRESAPSGAPFMSAPKITGASLGLGFQSEKYYLDVAFTYDSTDVDVVSGRAFSFDAPYINYDIPLSVDNPLENPNNVDNLLVGSGSVDTTNFRFLMSFGLYF